MSKLKKWQCPHCPQDSDRRWNIVVHIRRKHGFGNPVENKDSGQVDAADKTNNNREYSQRHPNNSRYTVGYKTTRRGNDNFGDMIDYMYRFLTTFEENIYKTGEIKRIADRYNSSMTPKRFPSTSYDPRAFANAFQAWLLEEMKNYHSLKQRDSDTRVAASSNQEIKKTHDPFSSVEKDNTLQSSSYLHPVSSRGGGVINDGWKDEWIEEDGWMIKRDMYGNLMSAYRIRESIFDT